VGSAFLPSLPRCGKYADYFEDIIGDMFGELFGDCIGGFFLFLPVYFIKILSGLRASRSSIIK
jgi:hypothetical protein